MLGAFDNKWLKNREAEKATPVKNEEGNKLSVAVICAGPSACSKFNQNTLFKNEKQHKRGGRHCNGARI